MNQKMFFIIFFTFLSVSAAEKMLENVNDSRDIMKELSLSEDDITFSDRFFITSKHTKALQVLNNQSWTAEKFKTLLESTQKRCKTAHDNYKLGYHKNALINFLTCVAYANLSKTTDSRYDDVKQDLLTIDFIQDGCRRDTVGWFGQATVHSHVDSMFNFNTNPIIINNKLLIDKLKLATRFPITPAEQAIELKKTPTIFEIALFITLLSVGTVLLLYPDYVLNSEK